MDNQKITNALNFLLEHRGYLKWGKERLGKIVKLEGEELDSLYKEVRRIRTETDHSGKDSLDGYWIKTKSISAYFRTKRGLDLNEITDYLTKTLPKIKPIEVDKYQEKQGVSVGILNIYDIHLDKIPLDMSKRPTVEEYLEGIKKAAYSIIEIADSVNMIDTIIFPVGGDLFNTNGFTSTTKKGTPQQVAIDHSMAFKLGVEFIISVVNTLRSKGYKVFIPVIYGNHDYDADFYLGVVLETLYKTDQSIVVDNDLVARKYCRYGNNMFGFGHGDLEKGKVSMLPLIMATEKADMWATTKYRTFYLGDIHHKEEFKFLKLKDFPGCTVSFLRSVSVTDKWHSDNMFIGIPRTLEIHVYNYDGGNVCNLLYNL